MDRERPTSRRAGALIDRQGLPASYGLAGAWERGSPRAGVTIWSGHRGCMGRQSMIGVLFLEMQAGGELHEVVGVSGWLPFSQMYFLFRPAAGQSVLGCCAQVRPGAVRPAVT